MFALLFSSALLAASPAPINTTYAPAPVGYSDGTTRILERFDNGTLKPVRARRPFMVGAEAGLNSISGLGLVASYSFNPHFSLDAGGGYTLDGARAGLRGRYNFFTRNWTPFVGLGASYLYASQSTNRFGSTAGPGPSGKSNSPQDAHWNGYGVAVQSAPFGTATTGLSYMGDSGFSVLASIGWSQLLDRKSNIVVTQGALSTQARREAQLAHGSGPVAALMLGYSF